MKVLIVCLSAFAIASAQLTATGTVNTHRGTVSGAGTVQLTAPSLGGFLGTGGSAGGRFIGAGGNLFSAGMDSGRLMLARVNDMKALGANAAISGIQTGLRLGAGFARPIPIVGNVAAGNLLLASDLVGAAGAQVTNGIHTIARLEDTGLGLAQGAVQGGIASAQQGVQTGRGAIAAATDAAVAAGTGAINAGIAAGTNAMDAGIAAGTNGVNAVIAAVPGAVDAGIAAGPGSLNAGIRASGSLS